MSCRETGGAVGLLALNLIQICLFLYVKSVFGIFYFLILLLKKPGFGVEIFVHSVCQVDCKIIPFGDGKALRDFSSKTRHTGSEILFPSDQKFQICGDIFCREISCSKNDKSIGKGGSLQYPVKLLSAALLFIRSHHSR